MPFNAELEARLLQVMPRYRWTAAHAAALAGDRLKGKQVIVTGVTSGIGLPTAAALASTGCHLTLTARDVAKGDALVASLQASATAAGGSVRLLPLDLASYASVLAFATAWGSTPVDILLHNAGVNSQFSLTADGDDQQLQVNFLSVVLLTEKLRNLLAPHARVVVVSSSAHRMVPSDAFSTLLQAQFNIAEADAAAYNMWVAYGVSKSAVIMYMNTLNAELEAAGHTARAFSLNPGACADTSLGRHIPSEVLATFAIHDDEGNLLQAFKTQAQCAATSVWAVTTDELAGQGGIYCEDSVVTPKTLFNPPAFDFNNPEPEKFIGTAPHVWDRDASEALTAQARQLLVKRGLLLAM